MQAMVVSSNESLGTCKNQLGDMATIDFFVISRCLKKPLLNCEVDLGVDPHPHRPVLMTFSLARQDQTYLAFQKPPDIPVVKGKEVEKEGEQWDSVLNMLSQLLACNPKEVSDAMLFEAYGNWAEIAEIAESQLAELAGVKIKKGFRSRAPVLVERRVDQQRSKDNKWQEEGACRPLTWLLGRALEFRKACEQGMVKSSKVKALSSIILDNPPSWCKSSPEALGWLQWLQDRVLQDMGGVLGVHPPREAYRSCN